MSTQTGCLQSVLNLWNRNFRTEQNFFSQGSTTLTGLGRPCEFPPSHSDTPHSAGLLWTSDHSVVETSTFQRTRIRRDISLLRLNHHIRQTTISWTPLHEWSVRRTDLYLTTHNNQKGQTSMPPAEFERVLPASERPKTHAVHRAATGIGLPKYRSIPPLFSNKPTNWTSLWAPLFRYELRMHWNRKRSDFTECNVKKCYLKRCYCTV